jgi:hypothetical protein
MLRTTRIPLGLLFLLSAAAGLWAQTPAATPVTGTAYLATDGHPVAGARVTLFDLSDLRRSSSTLTDADGRFTISPGIAKTKALSQAHCGWRRPG